MNRYLIILITLLAIPTGGGVWYITRPRIKPVVAVSSTPSIVVPKTPKDCSVTDAGVIIAVNKYRAQSGLSPVAPDPKLEKMANYRAEQQNGSMDNHVGFRPYLSSYWPGHPQISEIQNQMGGCVNSDARVIDFKLSQTHWDALNNPRYDSVGVGYVNKELVIELGDMR